MSEVEEKPNIQKERDKKIKMDRAQELYDLKQIMALPHGRRFIWRLLTHCRVFGSIWNNSAQIHYNAGMQDVGHFIQNEVIAADDMAFINMMKESRENLL